ncbi:hypothetical protein ACJMK2_040948 [Sinanodonta woodiana]|uniref:Uncharacterized protein n=1 Tax=Sinanodonta woodiana TaxID=1069815 RepID=A0ABD3W2J8_SINWO
MLDDALEDTSLSTSPLGRLHLSEGSDVFKAVMREFCVGSRSMLDNTNGPLTRNEASLSKKSYDDDALNPSSACERKHIIETYESICPHVRWVDEVLNMPLVNKCSDDSRERPDHLGKTEEPKSILKCRAPMCGMVSNR